MGLGFRYMSDAIIFVIIMVITITVIIRRSIFIGSNAGRTILIIVEIGNYLSLIITSTIQNAAAIPTYPAVVNITSSKINMTISRYSRSEDLATDWVARRCASRGKEGKPSAAC